MGYKLLLMRDDRVIWQVQLSSTYEGGKEFNRELEEMHREVGEFTSVMEAFSNRNRMRMIARLLRNKDHTMRFKEFIEKLGMNPKTIREHACKLHEAGFLEFPSRGRYRLSEFGRYSVIMTGLAFRQMLRALREECEKC
jgi:predicted transcriptional regulator